MFYRSRTILVIATSLLVASCDKCRSYSAYSCEQIKTARYNVYVADRGGPEQLAGTVDGLANCDYAAQKFASSRGKKTGEGWTYACCMKTAKSDCAEKHRSIDLSSATR